jgi:hypothetical protein
MPFLVNALMERTILRLILLLSIEVHRQSSRSAVQRTRALWCAWTRLDRSQNEPHCIRTHHMLSLNWHTLELDLASRLTSWMYLIVECSLKCTDPSGRAV